MFTSNADISAAMCGRSGAAACRMRSDVTGTESTPRTVWKYRKWDISGDGAFRERTRGGRTIVLAEVDLAVLQPLTERRTVDRLMADREQRLYSYRLILHPPNEEPLEIMSSKWSSQPRRDRRMRALHHALSRFVHADRLTQKPLG